MSGNTLKEKFLASASLKAVYHQEYQALYQKLYASGTALTAIDTLTRILKTSGADATQVDKDAAALRTTVRNRTTALAADPVATGRTP